MEVLLTSEFNNVRIPKATDKVYKDECIYSFRTPETDEGLYVGLSSFFGLSRSYLTLHFEKTGERLYLLIKKKEKPAPPPTETVEEPPAKKPTRLAIGVEGGFDGGIKEVEYEETYSLVVLPEFVTISLPNVQIPQNIQDSIAGIISVPSASKQQTISAWEGDKKSVSRYADNLVQLDNGVKVPPSGWKCNECELTTNLWVNLTDGSIHCGRRYFDGSGGNNHAMEHYERTRYPLVVKLGTITPNGADVFSYAEDEMVEDPHLPEHLAHFGINIALMSKTENTITELEIEMNMRIGEWTIIQEAGKELVPLYGSGYTGLRNLGNSCYMNAVMQVLFSIPVFVKRYYDCAEGVFMSAPPGPVGDFEVQMSKLACGLLSGLYSQKPLPRSDEDKDKPQEQRGISPQMFKAMIGRGHAEFSTSRQQDAQEFFLYVLESIDRNQRLHPGTVNPADCFKYKMEERLQCCNTGKVRYTNHEEKLLQFCVPMDMAINKDEVKAWEEKKKLLEANKQRINQEEVVRARVPFKACLDHFTAETTVQLKTNSQATKRNYFASFPDYLVIQMNRFTVKEDWTPIKYDVLIDVPEELDLSHLRGKGLQPGEQLLTDDEDVVVDEGLVSQLVAMGFDLEGCKKAVYFTHNQGVEAAMNWVLEHMGDEDFATPLNSKKTATIPQPSTKPMPSEDSIALVMSLGFSMEQSILALQNTDNNVERAADWLFNHPDEASNMEVQKQEEKTEPPANSHNETGKYSLVAFISHMGTSATCGHYVCHIKKEGRWVIYNDTKVAISEAPPREMAYLYFYKRDQ